MSVHTRNVATGLRNLADDIATGDRPITRVRWYQCDIGMLESFEVDPAGGECVPIVPRAVHEALCRSTSTLIEDEEHEVIVCGLCKLAVENGAV